MSNARQRKHVSVPKVLRELGVAKGNVETLLRHGYVTLDGHPLTLDDIRLDYDLVRGRTLRILGREKRLGCPLARPERNTAMNSHPQVLIDGWQDGGIEERGWVEVTPDTATAETALVFAERELPDDVEHLAEMGYELACGDRSWHRPIGEEIDGYRIEFTLGHRGRRLACRYCNRGKVIIIDELQIDGASLGVDPATLVGDELTKSTSDMISRAQGKIVKSHEEKCDECYGTGSEVEAGYSDDEPYPWEECSEDDPEALEFWNITVVRASETDDKMETA